MSSETRNCQNCKNSFVIEPDDFTFYEKMKVPAPTWCPECRFVRRLSVRNERSLYKRKCDLCGQDKILIYSPDSPYTVYCFQCWWSDKWDGIVFGRKYDFLRPFFTQFAELYRAVPRMGIIQQGLNVNSEYTNRVSDNKNCYLIFASANNEDCFYGEDYWNSKSGVDCYNLKKSENCFECIDCVQCSNLKYSQECNSCSNSSFLLNCRNCESCFGCINLRNKSYCLFNEQLSKEDYNSRLKQVNLGSRAAIRDTYERLEKMKQNFIVPSIVEHHGVNVTGNWLENCKDAKSCFACSEIEEGKFLFGVNKGKDIFDLTYWSMNSELIYESANIGRQCASVAFSHESWDQLREAQYCINCHNSANLFGCVGLRNKQYCIFNKQYTKEEYEKFLPQVKEHMQKMPYKDSLGRIYSYGEFFPIDAFPFAYNETIAQEYFPMTKESAIAQGYRWRDLDAKSYAITKSPNDLPDDVSGVADSIVEETIGCLHAGKCNHQCTTAFKVRKSDLDFYRAYNIPIPDLCPNCRHYLRLGKRNPMKLWHRKCQCAGGKSGNEAYKNTAQHSHGADKCPNEFETSYAPDRKEVVYCEQCYNSEVV